MTGRFALAESFVVQTFRYRQSSFHSRSGSQPAGSCGHDAPNCVALRIPAHLFTGWGGFQRRSPTGGVAYGTPRNATSFGAELKCIPSRAPASSVTVGGEDPHTTNGWLGLVRTNARQHATGQWKCRRIDATFLCSGKSVLR